MSTKQKEVECIQRLLDIGLMVEEWMDFLLENKLLDSSGIPAFALERNKALYIHNVLSEGKKSEKVLLLDFEWNVLPVERIKVTVVTTRNTKEFVYNANR